MARDTSGNIYVTGYSYGSGTFQDYCTIKYDSDGTRQWVRRYDGPVHGGDEANDIAIHNGSGDVYVTGYRKNTASIFVYCTIMYNSAGTRQWIKTYYNTPDNSDQATAIAVDGSGNAYVTGISHASAAHTDYATVKYSNAGNQMWVNRYDGSAHSMDNAYDIVVDGSGDVCVTGSALTSTTSTDFATIKYSSGGAVRWIRLYNGPDNKDEVANAMAVDGSGNFYVTGRTRNTTNTNDYATVMYSSAGVKQWVRIYDGPGHTYDTANAIAVDGSGNAYVTGESENAAGNEDYATIKYAP